jgi:hypothetical protein
MVITLPSGKSPAPHLFPWRIEESHLLKLLAVLFGITAQPDSVPNNLNGNIKMEKSLLKL